ncbi:MAG: divergent polysaccharide deacetylase family protein [Armatimonadota bacterium]|nr:divergent polysaccharide deacetylase family protein [Armatimonadota bacterium]MDR7453667.1 divergent polysaccharide deacetylase family protein [Armatimonadota bacterium]
MPRRAPARRSGPRPGALALLALAVFAVGLAVGVGVPRAPAPSPLPPRVERPRPTPPPPAQPRPPRPRAEQPRAPAAPAAGAARAAIIFDDAGGSLADVEGIIAIGRPVTMAVLPGLAFSSEVARRARAAGLEVLLHLPIEAIADNEKLGPGAVRVAMSDDEIREVVQSGLASVPGAIGVNNHMGSRGTADARVMRAVLEVVRERGLIFVDSRTTKDTVAEALAAAMGVRTARRHVFLDNDPDEAAIRSEVRRLIAVARERGEAVAIGHVQRRTPRIIAGMLEEFDRQGVQLVPLSALAR